MTMHALTISQPYAELIASGEKWVENRTWHPPRWLAGKRLAIHAGKGTQYLTRKELGGYTTGAVVAVCTFVGSYNLSELRAYVESVFSGTKAPDTRIGTTGRTVSELIAHEHTEGPVCWVLDDVQRIDPVAARGEQGLWKVDVPEGRFQ